ncbi:outer membrane beta-barrel protein [Draconibacterium sediminis]|uniref:outer membrane beta-barrel protein n=1 Tax=Draconibacterium sediminis TaxID=1544798 RepID=UPI0026EC773B|nr:outer membrane beta-barrel protein [Draconibacterium sediminis]
MKQITIILCLLFAGYFSFSQNKLSAGIYAEGGYFFPKKTYSGESFENNTALGGGGFLQYHITTKFAAALQAGYRYKSNENTTRTYTPLEGYDYGYGSETETHSYKQHYLILPLKLSYLITKKLSVEAGVEAARILNYDEVHIDDLTGDKWFDNVNHKTEFDWILGIGYSISPKIKASLNYIQGFKEQGMGSIKTLDESYGQTYKNRMVMINLSYSIFGDK